jgi:hypothetical protein
MKGLLRVGVCVADEATVVWLALDLVGFRSSGSA